MTRRRSFIKLLGLSGTVSLLDPTHALAFDDQNPEGYVTNEEDQETYLIGPRRAPVSFMVDKNKKGVRAISFCREEIAPGTGIPVHKHLNEEEVIYVQYGKGVFTLGEKEFEVKAGSVANVPKGIWHGLRNTDTANLRMLFTFTPSGFENYFREIGIPKGTASKDLTDEQYESINKKYGVVYKPR
jgi:quercetin dioxygenase-like cupin family protein